MPRDGARAGAGRKKTKAMDPTLAQRVLAKVKAEELWVESIEKARQSKTTTELVTILKYLEDRAYGRPHESVDMSANVRVDEARRECIRDLIARLAGKSEQRAAGEPGPGAFPGPVAPLPVQNPKE